MPALFTPNEVDIWLADLNTPDEIDQVIYWLMERRVNVSTLPLRTPSIALELPLGILL
jgi:hypothetical protein